MGVLDDITGGKANFGTVLKAANVLQNAGGLNLEGIQGELLGSVIQGVGDTVGIDVSGVAGVVTPSGGPAGGGLATIATAAAVVGAGKLANDYSGSGAAIRSQLQAAANAPSGPRNGPR